MSNRTEQGRSSEAPLSGGSEDSPTSGDGAAAVEPSTNTNTGPSELADVAYTDDEGVMMPTETAAVEEAHHELLKREEFAFNERTGKYEYDIPVPEELAENIQNKGLVDQFNENSKVDRLVEEDDGYHLYGTAPRPEVGHFLLTMVEKGPALLGRVDA